MRKLIALVIFLWAGMVNAGGGGGGNSFVDGAHNYFPLDPPFVVNLRDGDRLRFMQAAIQVMTYDTKVIEALQKHAGPIRHELLMLLSDQTVAIMYDVKKRTALQEEALSAVQKVLEEYGGISKSNRVEDAEGKSYPSGVVELYFTDLVVQ